MCGGNILPTSRLSLLALEDLDWGLCPARPAGVFTGAGGREGGDRTPPSPPVPPAPPYRGRGGPPEPDSPVSPFFVCLTRPSPRPTPPTKSVLASGLSRRATPHQHQVLRTTGAQPWTPGRRPPVRAPAPPPGPASPPGLSSPRPSPPNKKVFWRQACHAGARSEAGARGRGARAAGRAAPPARGGTRSRTGRRRRPSSNPLRPPRLSPRKRGGASAGEAGAPRPRGRWPPRAPRPGAPRAPPAPRRRRVRAHGRCLSPAGKLAGARASSSTPGPP